MTGQRKKTVHRSYQTCLISADVTYVELRAVAFRYIDPKRDFNFKIAPSKVSTCSPWLQSL